MDNNFNQNGQNTEYNQQYEQGYQTSTFGGSAVGNNSTTGGMYVQPTANKVGKIIIIVLIIVILLCCCCCGGFFGIAFIGEKAEEQETLSEVDNDIIDMVNELDTDVISENSKSNGINSIEEFTEYFKNKNEFNLYLDEVDPENNTYNSASSNDFLVRVSYYEAYYLDSYDFFEEIFSLADIFDPEDIESLSSELKVGQLTDEVYIHEYVNDGDYQKCILTNDIVYAVITRKGTTMAVGYQYSDEEIDKEKLNDLMAEIGYY